MGGEFRNMDMEGAMPVYVIETTYHLPVYRQRRYDAETLDDACHLAIEDEGWDDGRSDVDTSGETFVTGIWQDAKRAYQGTALPIPASFDETVQRKAELFAELLALVREPARPMGLSREEFARWLPKALAIVEKADAIQEYR